MSLRVVISFVATLFAACGAQPAAVDDVPNEQCFVGWWLSSGSACEIFCPEQPECGSADCELRSVIGLLETHESVSASITQSETDQRFSAVGSIETRTWESPDAEHLALGGNEPLAQVVCEADFLTVSGIRYSRAGSDVSGALTLAHEQDSWVGVAY